MPPCMALRPASAGGAMSSPSPSRRKFPLRLTIAAHQRLPFSTIARAADTEWWRQSEAPSGSGASGSEGPSTNSGSSWGAKEAGSDRDFLHALGANQDYNINVSHGQNIDQIDSLFVGKYLGQKSDIADGSLRNYEFRKFDNIVGDFYLSHRFLEKVAVHFVKNYLVAMEMLDPIRTKIPLVLGIWGVKGMGKTFQTELAMKKLGVEAIIMSAGELEHEWAGTPGRLIRERYRKAAELSKNRGIFTALMINDLDAGIGHQQNTQITVNNQIVTATLMNICDDPVRVSVGQEWNEHDYVRRTPIIVTGNDFSKIYAPLVRDGRMEKFYWNPNKEELVSIVHHMYKEDGISYEDVDKLISRFGRQPLDFFGALRASTYDGHIRDWLVSDVTGGAALHDDRCNLKEMTKRLVTREGLPEFKPLELTLSMLMAEGERLEYEQEMVNQFKLSEDYFRFKNDKAGPGIGLGGD